MTPQLPNAVDWSATARSLSTLFAARASSHDSDGTFVVENYDDLRKEGVFSMSVPVQLGGGGASYAETCDLIRVVGMGCGSTALALSMHTHLVAATVWKWNHDKPSEPLLRRIASEQCVLLSTGATDWINSNGHMRRVDGGYRLTARKVFGSGGPAADLMITSAQFDDPTDGPQVLHFGVPMTAQGVEIQSDWDTLGMRGTGSNTVLLTDVFVPEASIALRRPQEQWHPAWAVALGVAPALYMAAYVGIAEAAVQEALTIASGRPADPLTQLAAGEMINQITAARLAWQSMVNRVEEYEFAPTLAVANEQVVCKTLCGRGVLEAVERACDVAGARSFYKRSLLERLNRDVRAAAHHPLPERRQQQFSGRVALGHAPV